MRLAIENAWIYQFQYQHSVVCKEPYRSVLRIGVIGTLLLDIAWPSRATATAPHSTIVSVEMEITLFCELKGSVQIPRKSHFRKQKNAFKEPIMLLIINFINKDTSSMHRTGENVHYYMHLN